MRNSEYKAGNKVLIALDCIIFGFDQERLMLLLIKRDFEPEKGHWSLTGGFLKKNESLDSAADRIRYKLTGLTDIYMEQLLAFGQVGRDPVERTVSVAYYALINIKNHDHELSKKYGAKWFDINHLPQLIFDHGEMVKLAISRLKYRASTKPIGFELLPEKFTMRELQKLYEAIYGRAIDKRNFIKKISSMGLLIKLDEKDKSSSKKGSYLFKFDEEAYNTKLSNGFIFEL